MDKAILQKCLESVHNAHTGDKVSVWYCSPVPVRDADKKIIKEFTAIKLAVEFSPDDTIEIFNLKAKGMKAGISGMITSALASAKKAGFTCNNLKELNSENYYFSICWAKYAVVTRVVPAISMLTHLSKLESIADDNLDIYDKIAIENLTKPVVEKPTTAPVLVKAFEFQPA